MRLKAFAAAAALAAASGGALVYGGAPASGAATCHNSGNAPPMTVRAKVKGKVTGWVELTDYVWLMKKDKQGKPICQTMFRGSLQDRKFDSLSVRLYAVTETGKQWLVAKAEHGQTAGFGPKETPQVATSWAQETNLKVCTYNLAGRDTKLMKRSPHGKCGRLFPFG